MMPDAIHKHLFYAEMAKLLEAGFDIRKAAKVLTDSKLPPAQAVLLKDLNRGLDEGQSIATAFASDAGTISGLERSIISAGERGGKLAPAFQHLAEYFGMLAATRREALKSLIYPIVVLHLGIVIAVVPRALMEGKQTAGEILANLGITLLIVYVAALAVVLAIRAVLKAAPMNAAIDRLLGRIPWVGKARKNLAMARFCKVYHSCILAGISMAETVRLAAEASHSGVVRDAGTRLEKTARAGTPLGPQFLAEDAFPTPFARSYATGEEAGTLDKDLANWSNRFQAEAGSSARTVSVMLPKVLYFLVLAFVAWKVVGFYQGYYSSLEQIGD